ncbi:adenosylcobinamide-GDP ribazoletransferase [Labrys okinawensis]|nr:adenosylcobinamide-GDP ribazoletransferase [Labrys okinawensis]
MMHSSFLAGVPQALRFWSRLPVPVLSIEIDPHGRPDMERLAPATPLAGAVLGLAAAIVLVIAHLAGLPATVAVIFAVAALAVMTGAMHEDGLADVADGFGGGGTLERKLEIMRDSRIGSYGATALVLALAARVSLLAGLLTATGNVWRTGLVLAAAVGTSRILGLLPLMLLGPARPDGAGASAGRLTGHAWRSGAVPAMVATALLAWAGTGHFMSVVAPLAGLAAAYAVTRLAERQIGGQTGDVCGAAVMLAEMAILAGALAPLGWHV